jgi:hypothetical protein
MILNPRSQPAALRDPSYAPLRLPGVLGSVPSVRRPSTTRRTALYTVRTGDSPSSIAANAGVSVTELLQVNPTKPRKTVNGLATFRTLEVGERINLPVARPRAQPTRSVDPEVRDAFNAIRAHTRMQQSLPAREQQMRAMAGVGLGAGYGEECGITSWCDAGLHCEGGQCVPDVVAGGGGGSCQSSSDCGPGMSCEGGVCSSQGSGGSGGAGNYGCTQDTDCG